MFGKKAEIEQEQQTQETQPQVQATQPPQDIYSNTMPGSSYSQGDGMAQDTSVTLSSQPSVLDPKEKVKRPTINYRYTIINAIGKNISIIFYYIIDSFIFIGVR